MIRFPVFLFLAILLLPTGVLYSAETDFDKICQYFSELDKLEDIDSITPLQRNDFIIQRINSNLGPESNARAAWLAIGSAVAEQRYELFKSTVESVLGHEWHCTPMQRWASITGEF